MTLIHDVVRVVAALSPHGQWVTVKAVAGALPAQFTAVAAAVAAAVQRRELESDQDAWGISWTRTPTRSSSTQSTVSRRDRKPPPPPRAPHTVDRP